MIVTINRQKMIALDRVEEISFEQKNLSLEIIFKPVKDGDRIQQRVINMRFDSLVEFTRAQNDLISASNKYNEGKSK